MSFQPILDAVGPEGLVLMAVCFVAVVWWGFRRPRRKNDDDDTPWPGEDGAL